ncbi:hypothetical protein FOY74_02145 [Mycoplasma capricolum subsp. capripneumoniae]|uniref:hypothetical protein n=2 Tax=Mycoplasma capricolum TaxID=2095 RepID=UPI0003059B52|nr:hypothetical protein [Mycoplasma capricolum]AOQ22121.1 hypothetical protein M1601_02180 [Mycoplasma capricolum subsp. capripneumoniae M1601]QIN46485.1 hypothetical protein FOY55_02145 [Mycoplasma capricolum subsp. capripneumoniae]QIN47176.1 hypothetical protein FOY69_02150 [Mycoplasma capricolum subsp. capripneumoniae]QIN48549.1 hypothetical protein FOY71_02140 [Mycoplasma capricolum subsp. capripneumoniae]QIN49237.1 hypothetical protein FOY73_02145 [Mycoplasma capricolum subsp. capripneumo
MKKLLVLLSGSVLLSLSFSFIYFLNFKSNNRIALKQQEQKEETDLSKIFYNAYVSVINEDGKNLKDLVIEAIKKKYNFLDFSLLDIEVGKDKNGRESAFAFIKPKVISNNKYKNSEEIKYYIKKNLSLETENTTNLEKISINTETEILKQLKKKIDTSSFEEKGFFVTDITENSAIVNAKEENDDFYGKVKVKFNAKKKTLESVFYNFKLEIKQNSNKDDVIKYLINKKPNLKSEKLTAQIDLSKDAVIISVDNSSENYQGSTTLLFALPEEKQPITPNTPKTPEKPEPSQPKNESKSNDILPRSEPNSKISTPSAPIIDKTPNKFEIKKPIPTIPNNTMNKSDNKTNKSGNSKTGIIVGTTLGVSSIVASGAAGSWLYFKKRK